MNKNFDQVVTPQELSGIAQQGIKRLITLNSVNQDELLKHIDKLLGT